MTTQRTLTLLVLISALLLGGLRAQRVAGADSGNSRAQHDTLNGSSARSDWPAKVTAAPLPQGTALRRETLLFLERGFCSGGLCENNEWQRWIDASGSGQWLVGELRTVQHALVSAIAALDQAGLDGQTLIAGYRFQRHDDLYVGAGTHQVAVVRHSEQVIVLADGAFTLSQRFAIFHELGHVVDNRLNRRLSEMLFGAATADSRPQLEPGLTGSQWLRVLETDSPYEMTADAFAVYVMRDFAGFDSPHFTSTPADFDYDLVSRAAERSLQQAAQITLK